MQGEIFEIPTDDKSGSFIATNMRVISRVEAVSVMEANEGRETENNMNKI